MMEDRKSTRLNSSHQIISYAVFCLKKKNAKVKNISADLLKFKEIQINEGPRLKRGRPVSRGRWHPHKRRMSHIRVVLQTVEKTKDEGRNKDVLQVKTKMGRKDGDRRE